MLFRSGTGLKGLSVLDCFQSFGNASGVLRRIQRLDVSACAALPAASVLLFPLPLRFHFLNMGAVFEHEADQSRRGGRAVHGSAKTFPREPGQKARMIDMRVSKKNKTDIGGTVILDVEITRLYGGVALMHAAIHAKTDAARFHKVTGTGNSLCRAEKMNFHTVLTGRESAGPLQGRPQEKIFTALGSIDTDAAQ